MRRDGLNKRNAYVAALAEEFGGGITGGENQFLPHVNDYLYFLLFMTRNTIFMEYIK
jgi:hypothetical protein